jgi:ABC-2 type transport system ATP-binding protein
MSQAAQAKIQLDGVTRAFGNTLAVDDVSFHVDAGEVLGFIGPNGAGKTTSMRILSTLDSPTAGEAWVDGFSVVDDPDRVRERMGWMPDGFGTYPNINCEEYLDFFARSYGLRGKNRLRAIKNVMGFTQLNQLAKKPISGLSKGMKQRLCLGRALIHNPKVLILDEPAAGLDPRARIELREMILELADEGKSLLISSHILSELAEVCDRVAIIEKGKLLAIGSVDSLLKRETGQTIGKGVSQLEVKFVSEQSDVLQWFNSRVDVELVSSTTNSILFNFETCHKKQSELLAAIIDAKIEVFEFSEKQTSLEDVFLSVTRGEVQ